MKKLKKVLALSLALALTFALAACGKTATTSPSASASADASASASGSATEDGGGASVYFCISHMSNAWAVTASDSMKAAAKESNVNLTVLEAGKDINTQVSQIEMAVTNGAKAIIIEPVSAEGVLAAVKAAETAGVHCIIYNQNISDPTQATCFVGVSNADMGYMEMKKACEAINGKGNVAELLGPLGSEGQIGRSEGYDKALKEYPDVKVVFKEDAQWTTDAALTLVENWLSTGTQIDAVVSQNDNMALGAVKAFEDAGKKVPTFGVDAVADALTAIKDGRLTATVDQSTAKQSQMAIAAAVKLIKNETVEKEYLADPVLIDSTNVDKYITK